MTQTPEQPSAAQLEAEIARRMLAADKIAATPSPAAGRMPWPALAVAIAFSSTIRPSNR